MKGPPRPAPIRRRGRSGAGPHHIRALAEAVGKKPPASRYSPDMSQHAFLGSHERIKQVQKDYADKL